MKRVLAAGATGITAAGLLLVVAPAAHAASTLLVPGRYRTISAAISAAHNGDTVLVSPGTYHESLTIVGKAITVKASSSNPASTVIAAPRGRTPVMFQHVGDQTSLRGFRIINGYAPSGQGGGITVANGASPIIVNNVIEFNHATDGGGILVYNGSNPDIAYNYIQNNTASSFGGGVFAVIGSNPTVHHNVIRANRAYGGGGVYLESNSGNRAARAGGHVLYNSIYNNAASQAGGGIMLRTGEVAQIAFNQINSNRAPYGGGIEVETNGSGPSIRSNTLSGNTAATSASQPGSGSGGGIAVFGQSTPLIQGNTVTSNASTIYGGGIVLAEGSSSRVVGNNIAGNRVTSTASGAGGGGIFEANSDSQIWNNVIRGNSARGGGGLSFSGTGSWVVQNNTVIGNAAASSSNPLGGGIFIGGKTTGKTSIVSNIVAGNNDVQIFDAGHLSTYWNNVVNNAGKGAFYAYGVGTVTDISQINGNSRLNAAYNNISGNLGFVDAAHYNYRLASASVAIDRARAAGAPSNDISGAPRPWGRGYDVGAYEFRG